MPKKPTIKEGPAAQYARPHERVVEFSDGQSGGLISMFRNEVTGTLRVDLYRLDPDVEVVVETKGRAPKALPDDDDLAVAHLAAQRTAHRDSNDDEIDAWREVAELALARLNVTVRDLTDEEIEEIEEEN